MRYHYEKPPIYLSMYGQRYCCDHPVYNHCTLFLVGERGPVSYTHLTLPTT